MQRYWLLLSSHFFRVQVWRPAFLKYSFALINVLHWKIQSLIVSALNHDTWRGLSTLDEHVPESDMSLQSRVRTRPRAVPTPPSDSTSVLRGTVTPSCNSAFQPVRSQRSICLFCVQMQFFKHLLSLFRNYGRLWKKNDDKLDVNENLVKIYMKHYPLLCTCISTLFYLKALYDEKEFVFLFSFIHIHL